MSSGWVQRTLAELAVYQNGRAFKPTDWTEIGLPIVRIAQITDPNAKPNHYDGEDVDNRHIIDNGDLLFSWSATLAVLKWNNGPAILNQHIFKVVENDGVCRDFLRHLLHHSLPALAERSHGSTMKHIRKGVLREHLVSIPPLPEQRKIAAILSSVDDAIEKIQAVIDQVQVVKRGLMQELLTRGLPGRHTRFKQTEIGEIPEDWVVNRIGELGKKERPAVKAGPFGSSLRKSYYASEGYRVYGQEQVLSGDLSVGNYYIDEERFQSLKSCEVKAGDILVSLVGTFGKAIVVPSDAEPGIINPRLLRLSLDPQLVLPEFFCFWLHSGGTQKLLVDAAQGGTMGVLNAGIVKNLSLGRPSLPEQSAIVAALASVELRLESEAAVQAAALRSKTALMYVLLTGELRVTPDTEAE